MLLGIDVDDVLAGFQDGALAIANEAFGHRRTLEDFKDWGFFQHYTPEEQEYLLEQCTRPGFCSSLPVLPGAKEAVAKLRELAEVYIITSPFDRCHTWVSERAWWLKTHFGFEKDHLIHTSAKHLVNVDVFIDDRPSNVIAWAQRNVNGLALLWPLANNLNCPMTKYRVEDWDDVFRRVSSFKKAKGL